MTDEIIITKENKLVRLTDKLINVFNFFEKWKYDGESFRRKIKGQQYQMVSQGHWIDTREQKYNEFLYARNKHMLEEI